MQTEVFEEQFKEEKIDRALRPTSFDSYIGNPEIITRLKIAIEAAKERNDPLGHCLFMGNAGLGKTSLANIVANECRAGFRSVMGPSIKSMGDIIEILKKLQKNDILFIDECHAIDRKIEETLYSALEDFKITIKLGNKEIINIDVNPFCCIGATTLPGRMTAPFRDRFDIVYTMQFYTVDELSQIISDNIGKLDIICDDYSAIENIARRSRGIPRIANRLIRRIRDYAQINNNNVLTNEVVNESLEIEGIDALGLTSTDKKYLKTLFEVYKCGPCGVDAMASSTCEDKSTLIEFVEPFLQRKGFIARTKGGRILTADGMKYICDM